jgi:hypothetical protein
MDEGRLGEAMHVKSVRSVAADRIALKMVKNLNAASQTTERILSAVQYVNVRPV